ncbi:hypothetical protein LI328DRAFT_5894 [Trichoderma asperelloides]|nr:hypothetical protein LI328DRAFT_5894 [Trichoderma asperelloides]
MVSGDRCLLRHGQTSPVAKQTTQSHLLSPFCSLPFFSSLPRVSRKAQSASTNGISYCIESVMQGTVTLPRDRHWGVCACVSGEALDKLWTTNTQEHGKKRASRAAFAPLGRLISSCSIIAFQDGEIHTRLRDTPYRVPPIIVSPFVFDKPAVWEASR